ncbi:peptidylprolyl isomerase [Flavobacterium difficile]|uniref:Periplasmic chaperone PpiD n=1 Tax=Flavobacterium difficile TaxID=2709659 RepID=A0ABX0I3C5_9FLAO|nr:peptidylprolyl isomerase [Flavobacterium difficile]NHM01695.1 peptidylprolyl isomerase [Flavobacterium difficile]
MAILSKIRQRSILLVLIIALALFSFVLADVIKSGAFGGNSNDIGSINGTEFEYQEFMNKVANVEKQQQGISGTQALNSVWEQEVRKALLTEQYDKIGLLLGKEQLMTVIKTNPQLSQDPRFLNAAGKFDDNKFAEYINSLQSNPDQTLWSQWKSYELQIEDFAKEQIYNTLIKSSVYTTKVEGKLKYERDNNKVDFDYVALAFSTVNDDQVKVTDEEMIAFMKKNPKKYKSDNSRTVEFVLVENKPSKADEAVMKSKIDGFINGKIELKNGVNDTIPSFKSATNLANYVNKYSEIKFDSTYVAKKDINPQFAEQLYALAPGQVFGPYTDNGYSKLSRVAGRKSGSSAKVSHILIAYKGAMQAAPTVKLTKEEAKAKAEGLLAQVNANPSSMAMLAMVNSDDQGSKQNGGVYDNVTPKQMVKSFDDFLFGNPVGKTGVVETDFGFHVMKVDAKYDAVLLATVALKVQPSEQTEDANYNKALKVESDATANGLEKAAKAAGLKIAPVTSFRAYDETVSNLGVQRQIVTWAFNNDSNINDVKRFDIANVGFAIVKLKAKNDEGLLPLDQAKQIVEPLIKNEKKAAILKKKMTGATLEAVSKATGSSISPAVGATMASPVVPNLGYEPKVVGTALGLASGKTSKVIEGNSGLFMVRTKAVTKAAAVKDYKSQIDQINQQTKGSAPFRVIQSLKDKADIVDNRGKF